MIRVNKQTVQSINNGDTSLREAAIELSLTYPTVEIAEAFLELYLNTPYPETINKIPITLEQFETIKSLFRVKGINPLTGEIERRGRPSQSIYSNNGSIGSNITGPITGTITESKMNKLFQEEEAKAKDNKKTKAEDNKKAKKK